MNCPFCKSKSIFFSSFNYYRCTQTKSHEFKFHSMEEWYLDIFMYEDLFNIEIGCNNGFYLRENDNVMQIPKFELDDCIKVLDKFRNLKAFL